jgi:methionyl-tRNA formyltransferase
MARIVFLGTPAFGATILEALVADGHDIVAVVTQPDRAAGRGRRQIAMPEVKQVALTHELTIFQPESLRRDRAVVERLQTLASEVLVLASFAQILRRPVLELAPHGCIGVHASLLPKYRGAAPIPAAILQGERETGITLMLTDTGMDTGPIIAQGALVIDPRETTETLTARLAQLGAELLVRTLPSWLHGDIAPQPQNEALASYARPIDKADGAIDWRRPAVDIDRQIRAYTPWPGAYCGCKGASLKVLQAHPLPEWRGEDLPGRVVQYGEQIAVATGAGLLVLDELQLAGRRAMDACAFACGRCDFVGSVLASPP